MIEHLTYRLFEERDLPSLLRLWEEAGWGTLTAEQWREWFVETPHGACLVSVAVDASGEVAAQEMFTPARVSVGGREVRALRLSAPILRRDLRQQSVRSVEHPVIGLYLTAAEAAARAGFRVVYALPEHGWLPFFRWAPRFGLPRFADSEYECAALPLERGDGRRGAPRLAARPADGFGAEYDELWRSARASFPIDCGVVRDSAWVRFRNSGRISVEVRDPADGRLVGYSATKRQTGLLADVLARRPEELADVIDATARWLSDERGRLVPESLTHLKAMRTPALGPALDALGCEAADFTFAFACNTFDASLAPEEVAPERWYVMPGD